MAVGSNLQGWCACLMPVPFGDNQGVVLWWTQSARTCEALTPTSKIQKYLWVCEQRQSPSASPHNSVNIQVETAAALCEISWPLLHPFFFLISFFFLFFFPVFFPSTPASHSATVPRNKRSFPLLAFFSCLLSMQSHSAGKWIVPRDRSRPIEPWGARMAEAPLFLVEAPKRRFSAALTLSSHEQCDGVSHEGNSSPQHGTTHPSLLSPHRNAHKAPMERRPICCVGAHPQPPLRAPSPFPPDPGAVPHRIPPGSAPFRMYFSFPSLCNLEAKVSETAQPPHPEIGERAPCPGQRSVPRLSAPQSLRL